jgi:hypothetical protein
MKNVLETQQNHLSDFQDKENRSNSRNHQNRSNSRNHQNRSNSRNHQNQPPPQANIAPVPKPEFEKRTGWVTEYTDAFTNFKKEGHGGIKFDIPFTNPPLQNSNYNSNRTKQNTIPKTQKISANTESQPKISDDLKFRRNPMDEILCRDENKNLAQKSKSLTRSHTPQNPQSRSVTPNKGSPKKPTNNSQ